MTIALNARFKGRALTGVERYACEIASRMENLRWIAPRANASGLRGHAWEQTVLPWSVGKELLWSPCNTGPLAVRNQVVTIHDCAFLDDPACFSRAFAAWYGWLMPRLAKRVRKIITVSRFSRERILECLGISPEKVAVIYNGVDTAFRPHEESERAAVRMRLRLPERFVLSVGSNAPRKNLARLLEAWELLAPHQPDTSLVLVGAPNSNVFGKTLSGVAPPRTIWTGYLDHTDLPAVYSAATAFVFPSSYEGFGLPILEAMACGTPVASSSAASMPEVAGNAAHYFDHDSAESIAEGICDLLDQESLRRELSERGLVRAAEFTWDRAAQDTHRALSAAALES